jgi:NDP-sugar pyrophosphorylase family protein
MKMINRLFPSLITAPDDLKIPDLNGLKNPWELFSPSSGKKLISQISDKIMPDLVDYDAYRDVRFEERNGPIYIHPMAKIEEFVKIEGPCYIGKNAEIRHSAYLRGGTWISEGGVVGHSSEVKNSLFLPGAKAPHFNYVGDSILGEKVNLGAGVKISNVRNDGLEIRIRDDSGEFILTGLRKFGALIGDGVEIGCNTVTNPGTIISPKLKINPNSVLKGWIQ